MPVRLLLLIPIVHLLRLNTAVALAPKLSQPPGGHPVFPLPDGYSEPDVAFMPNVPWENDDIQWMKIPKTGRYPDGERQGEVTEPWPELDYGQIYSPQPYWKAGPAQGKRDKPAKNPRRRQRVRRLLRLLKGRYPDLLDKAPPPSQDGGDAPGQEPDSMLASMPAPIPAIPVPAPAPAVGLAPAPSNFPPTFNQAPPAMLSGQAAPGPQIAWVRVNPPAPNEMPLAPPIISAPPVQAISAPPVQPVMSYGPAPVPAVFVPQQPGAGQYFVPVPAPVPSTPAEIVSEPFVPPTPAKPNTRKPGSEYEHLETDVGHVGRDIERLLNDIGIPIPSVAGKARVWPLPDGWTREGTRPWYWPKPLPWPIDLGVGTLWPGTDPFMYPTTKDGPVLTPWGGIYPSAGVYGPVSAT